MLAGHRVDVVEHGELLGHVAVVERLDDLAVDDERQEEPLVGGVVGELHLDGQRSAFGEGRAVERGEQLDRRGGVADDRHGAIGQSLAAAGDEDLGRQAPARLDQGDRGHGDERLPDLDGDGLLVDGPLLDHRVVDRVDAGVVDEQIDVPDAQVPLERIEPALELHEHPAALDDA